MEILEERRKQRERRCDGGEEHPDDELTTDTATCSSNNQDKDSGFGRSTDSPEHRPLLARLQRRGAAHCLREQWRAEHPHTRRAARTPQEQHGQRASPRGPEGGVSLRNNGGGILGLENRFQQLLELKCQIRNGGECGVYSIRHSIECSLTEQGGGGDGEDDMERGGVEQELRMLNEELRSIELECQSIMQAHQLRQAQEPPQPPPGSPRHGQPRHGRLADIHEQPERSDGDKLREKDSSSAYNTAESARSTPLGVERSPEHSLQRHVSITNQKNLRMAASCSPPSGPIPIPIPTPQGAPAPAPAPGPHPAPAEQGSVFSSSPDQSNPSRSESDPALPADDERCEKRGRSRRRELPYPSYQTAPYAGPAGARQLQSYMQLLQQHSSLEYSQSQLSLLSVCREPRSLRPGEPRLEWKVKVRADGSRYVARRPARDRILRERALRIREERSGGMTTDDDAMSEMKMGRYWSKEERKQHLARAREQRKRREFMQKSRLECLREGPASGAEGRRELNILELSHKKMMKKRNKKILDNWMTIQELMSHGARVPEGSKVHNAFLSVTTV